MSKFVKDIVSKEIAKKLEGVNDALLVNVIGLDSNNSVVLRRQLREKNINLLVVKNSMAKRATEGTPLAAAFDGTEGTNAIVWLIVFGVLLARRRLAISRRLIGPGLLILVLPLLLLLSPPLRSSPGLAPDYLQSDGLLDGIRWFFGSGEFSRYGLRGGQELREAGGDFLTRMATGWTPFLWTLLSAW